MKMDVQLSPETGRTKDSGYQIGLRKTFDIAPDEAWGMLTSEQGLLLWLGSVDGLRLEKGVSYQTQDGATGVVRVVRPGSHVRLTWQPAGWQNPTLIQVRVIPSGAKTTISFHQDQLAGPAEREQMRQRWLQVMYELAQLFA